MGEAFGVSGVEKWPAVRVAARVRLVGVWRRFDRLGHPRIPDLTWSS